MRTDYRSKVDLWLLAVLAIAIGASAFVSINTLSAGVSASWWSLLLTAGVGMVLPTWLLLGTRYTLQPEQLVVRSGPLKWRIALSDITAVTPMRSAQSAPALSLDRLRIEYGHHQSVMISPRDKERFVEHLEALRRAVAEPPDRA